MRDGARPGPGMRHARRAAHAAAGVAVAAALTLAAACGDEGVGDVDLPSATAGAPTGLPTGFPTGLPTGIPTDFPTDLPGVDAANIPEGFPVPPGAEQAVTEVGGGQTLRLTGVSAEDAFAYYRSALPDAGYTIESDRTGSGPIPGLISFTGHDVSGELGGVDVAGQSTVIITFSALN